MAITHLVGDVVPTEEELRANETEGRAIIERMGRWSHALPDDQRNGFLRPRLGAEGAIETVLALAREKGLSIEGMPLDGMEADLRVGKAGERMEKLFAQAQQLAADARISGYGEAWQAFLAYYGTLSTMATRDGSIATRLKPVREFMAGTKRTKKPESK